MDPAGDHAELRFLVLRPEDNGKLPSNAFLIAKTIETTAGTIVGGNYFDQNTKYLMKVRSGTQVDKLLKLNKLINGTEIIIEHHATLNSCMVVVSTNELGEVTEEDITAELKTQGVTKTHRFTRMANGIRVPTNSFLLTLNSVIRPEYIKIGLNRIRTRQYYPRPMVCGKCLAFGHTRKYCKATDEKCANCGGGAHGTCELPSKCSNCNGGHSCFSKLCPAYAKEQEIINVKIDHCISAKEARQIVDVAHQQKSARQVHVKS
ncbi:uncharacterized protein LOC128276163 [Anopheles cruzii]|uniref:uncharacterized protein LOC128276163 n=1 Tax=Anopheles cruzii TaxID=68878 RepID=UPI0022EC4F26|nr:uncharacterized protein LOC128276163 [Anopheles cruzii]